MGSIESTESKEGFKIEDLGDGLYSDGGDICCLYPIISSERTETGTTGIVVNEYEKYTITISYDIEGNKRKNPHWKRKYKEAAT